MRVGFIDGEILDSLQQLFDERKISKMFYRGNLLIFIKGRSQGKPMRRDEFVAVTLLHSLWAEE